MSYFSMYQNQPLKSIIFLSHFVSYEVVAYYTSALIKITRHFNHKFVNLPRKKIINIYSHLIKNYAFSFYGENHKPSRRFQSVVAPNFTIFKTNT